MALLACANPVPYMYQIAVQICRIIKRYVRDTGLAKWGKIGMYDEKEIFVK